MLDTDGVWYCQRKGARMLIWDRAAAEFAQQISRLLKVGHFILRFNMTLQTGKLMEKPQTHHRVNGFRQINTLAREVGTSYGPHYKADNIHLFYHDPY